MADDPADSGDPGEEQDEEEKEEEGEGSPGREELHHARGLQEAGGRAGVPAHARSGPRWWAPCPTPPPRGTAPRTPSTSTASASCARSTGRIRYLAKRLDNVLVVDPLEQPRRDRVFFGATVRVADEEGGRAHLPHRRLRRDRQQHRRHLLALAGGPGPARQDRRRHHHRPLPRRHPRADGRGHRIRLTPPRVIRNRSPWNLTVVASNTVRPLPSAGEGGGEVRFFAHRPLLPSRILPM